MATKVRWSLLIATVGQRNDRFEKLVKELLRQVKPFKGKIEILAYWNNFETSLSTIRKELVEEASGKYVSFIDDDDRVAKDYCKQIFPLLNKDYVGFKVKVISSGKYDRPAFHSIKYDKWWLDEKGYYRHASHLNPIKRSISLEAGWDSEGAEDYSWANRAAKLIKTENYIDKFMYYYDYNADDTIWEKDYRPQQGQYIRPNIKHKYFRYHPKSKEKS